VDPSAGVNDVEKILALPGLELRPLSRPARSQSLYRLRYLGSQEINKESKLAVADFKDINPMNAENGTSHITLQNSDCPEFIRHKHTTWNTDRRSETLQNSRINR
jgi:hypothetical protein